MLIQVANRRKLWLVMLLVILLVRGGCTKHSEENYNKLIYLGEPIFISAYHDYGDDNQGDDNQGDDNQKQDNQDDKKQDDKEKRQSYEDLLFQLSQLPPPPFTEYIDDDNTQNENKSSENQSDKNNDDWQAEKWDSPVDWNMAEIAIGIGSVANDLLNIANKGRLGDLSPDVLKRNAALGDLNSINNLEAASEITATQANALRKAAAGKAGNAAGAGQSLGNTLKNIGSKYKGAEDNIRTVSKSEFEQLKNNLLQGATKLPKDTNSNYSGTWYQLPNGQGRVGVRNSPKNGETLDFSGVNGLDKGFRIHQQ